MKILEILTEAKKKTDPYRAQDFEFKSEADLEQRQEMAKFIKKYAAPWLAQTQQGKLQVYRGIDAAVPEVFVKAIRQDRKPKDTDQERHQAFNAIISAAGGIANRSNSAFVSPSHDLAWHYSEMWGLPHVFIPLGKFHYTWSPYYDDWTENFTRDRIAKLMTTKYLKQALQQNAERYAAYEMEYEVRRLSRDISGMPKKGAKAQAVTAEMQLRLDKLHDLNSAEYKKLFAEKVREYIRAQGKDFEFTSSPAEPQVYDPVKVKKQIAINQGLQQAIKSENEIMIYVEPSTIPGKFLPGKPAGSVTDHWGLYIEADFYKKLRPLLK